MNEKKKILVLASIFLTAFSMTVGVQVLLYKLESVGVVALPAMVYMLILSGIIPHKSAKEIALSAGLIAGTLGAISLLLIK